LHKIFVERRRRKKIKMESKKIRIMLSKTFIDKLPAAVAMKGTRRNGRIFFFNSDTAVLIQNKTLCAAIDTRYATAAPSEEKQRIKKMLPAILTKNVMKKT
jgi:hypothetical protein